MSIGGLRTDLGKHVLENGKTLTVTPGEDLTIKPGQMYPNRVYTTSLPNGAEQVACRPLSYNPGDSYLQIVLCRWYDNKSWVTWLYNTDQRGASNGHYFDNEDDATNDYLTRKI